MKHINLILNILFVGIFIATIVFIAGCEPPAGTGDKSSAPESGGISIVEVSLKESSRKMPTLSDIDPSVISQVISRPPPSKPKPVEESDEKGNQYELLSGKKEWGEVHPYYNFPGEFIYYVGEKEFDKFLNHNKSEKNISNILEFIKYFKFTKEEFIKLLNDSTKEGDDRKAYYAGYDPDVLFSDDPELIQKYYFDDRTWEKRGWNP